MKAKFVLSVASVATAGLAAGALFAASAAADGNAASSTAQFVAAGNVDQAEAISHVYDFLSLRNAYTPGVTEYLTGLLPNQEYSKDGAAPQPWLAGVWHGHVTGVEAAAAYIDQYSAEQTSVVQVEVPVSGPEASWRVVEVTLSIEDDFDPKREAPESIRLAVTLGGGANLSIVVRAFEGQELVVFASGPGSYPFDDALYTAANVGTLIGFVDVDGNVSFPFLGEDSEVYVDGLDSISAIQTEAAEEKPVRNLVYDSGFYVPAE